MGLRDFIWEHTLYKKTAELTQYLNDCEHKTYPSLVELTMKTEEAYILDNSPDQHSN